MLWTFLSADEDRVRSKGRNIIVVGTAAGGLEALDQDYIDRIRAMLLDPRSDRPEDTLTHVKALMAEPRKAKSTR